MSEVVSIIIKGGVVMIPLLACSLISLALTIERLIFWGKIKSVWLEEKYRKTPGEKIAMAIALHYLILALRHDAGMESEIARDYCARAARWQSTACQSTVAALAAKATGEN